MEANEQEWNELLLRLSRQFRVTANYEFILFVIGVNERGSGFRAYSKEEKMDLMNLGSCVLLHQQGFTQRVGVDEQGWPLFLPVDGKPLPQQPGEEFFKHAMIEFFRNN